MRQDLTAVRKTAVRLADGRTLIYFGGRPERPEDYPDQRPLSRPAGLPQRRFDPVLGEWVMVAAQRQDRTFQPGDDLCPLCPSAPGRATEIPAPDYAVVAFENRFPALAGRPDAGDEAAEPAAGDSAGQPGGPWPGLLAQRPASGRCEVICFSPQHQASFADLTVHQAELVLAAWIDRTAELSGRLEVEQLYCFENRGAEIGVTLSHPHGQIYAYPFVTPRTARMLQTAAAYRARAGRNLFDDIVAAEQQDGSRIVADGEHWTAFVPHAARWPYEVHVYPHCRVADLTELPAAAAAEFCVLYLDLLRRFDRLFGAPAPYIAAWHQAPARRGPGAAARAELALHLELFTIRRAPGKLKYLAGAESGMGAFANDIVPETAAARLRDLS